MRKTTTAAVLLALALPATAGAAPVVTPPGNSEADQYFETVPGLVNPRSFDPDESVEDAVREGRLSPATARTLEQRGEAGEGLARVVAQTAPAVPGAGAGGADGTGGAGGASGTGLTGAALSATSDEQGLGALFSLIAIVMAAAAAGYAVAKWRTSAKRSSSSG